MVNDPELINKMINNINKLDDETIKEAIQEVEKEDIKILEELRPIGIIKPSELDFITPERYIQAIQNLLKRYKELEKENKELLEVRVSTSAHTRIIELEEENAMLKKVNNIAEDVTVEDITQVMNKSLEDFKREFIPISVIQNKIDEYREKRNKLADGHFWDNERNINEDTSLFIAIETLKLLLEERNK